MFGIGMPELVIIFVIALLVFGPKELPKIGKTIGKAMGEFRRASDELRDGIQREIDQAEREQADATPSSEVSVQTVPAEPPVAAAEPPSEPQLELPTAGERPAYPEQAKGPESGAPREPAAVTADARVAAIDTPEPTSRSSSATETAEDLRTAASSFSAPTPAPAPPETKHVG